MEAKHRNTKAALEDEWKIKERIHEDKIEQRNIAKAEMEVAKKKYEETHANHLTEEKQLQRQMN